MSWPFPTKLPEPYKESKRPIYPSDAEEAPV
jgi:hypothetical protein